MPTRRNGALLKPVRRKVAWGDLSSLERREFFARISEPDGNGCKAWHGWMNGGSPEWSRVAPEDAVVYYSQARRLLIESSGRSLGRLDLVFVTCENPGCIALEHLDVRERADQKITAEEKRRALARVQNQPSCPSHPEAEFRPYFKRGAAGVRAAFHCKSCQREWKQRRNEAGRSFKNKRGGA